MKALAQEQIKTIVENSTLDPFYGDHFDGTLLPRLVLSLGK